MEMFIYRYGCIILQLQHVAVGDNLQLPAALKIPLHASFCIAFSHHVTSAAPTLQCRAESKIILTELICILKSIGHHILLIKILFTLLITPQLHV